MKGLPVSEIVRIVGRENVLTSVEERYCYSYDASKLKAVPDCVAFPGSAEEASQLIKLANRERFPVFPRGAGSGMVGGALPYGGGLVMAATRLNRILEIDRDNMLAVVEPGVVTGDLQKRVQKDGLFYPPDPASLHFSTIGGNVAMCAGGPRAVKYGVTRDYVMGLEVVLPTGDIIQTGGRTMKGVVGYDLTRLMVGSEGTLGVFTKIILRLIPAPEGVRTMLAVFPLLEGAAQAVCNIIRNRVIPSTLELMDQASIEVVENYLKIGLPVDAEALLLIEVDGKERILDEEVGEISIHFAGLGADPAQ
jgi:glycolate oxidase